MTTPMTYPVNLQFKGPHHLARWRPLVQWFLAIPHLIIANVLSNLAGAIGLVSWFIILFTGKLPEDIAKFQVLILRYEARAMSYVLFMRDSYPAFEFDMDVADPGTDPISVDVVPQLENRNRLTVGLRFIWMIPIMLFAAVLSIAVVFAVIAAFFAVLFTGRWPDGLRSFVINASRLMLRANAYCFLLVDDYPPFRLEEPAPVAA